MHKDVRQRIVAFLESRQPSAPAGDADAAGTTTTTTAAEQKTHLDARRLISKETHSALTLDLSHSPPPSCTPESLAGMLTQKKVQAAWDTHCKPAGAPQQPRGRPAGRVESSYRGQREKARLIAQAVRAKESAAAADDERTAKHLGSLFEAQKEQCAGLRPLETNELVPPVAPSDVQRQEQLGLLNTLCIDIENQLNDFIGDNPKLVQSIALRNEVSILSHKLARLYPDQEWAGARAQQNQRRTARAREATQADSSDSESGSDDSRETPANSRKTPHYRANRRIQAIRQRLQKLALEVPRKARDLDPTKRGQVPAAATIFIDRKGRLEISECPGCAELMQQEVCTCMCSRECLCALVHSSIMTGTLATCASRQDCHSVTCTRSCDSSITCARFCD